MNWIEIWKFMAGIGFFLYGMGRLEYLLKKNTGRPLKLFLKKNTESLFKSITGGAIITGMLQSSSVVSLMVLAFVESGIMTFRNALGVIIGTNIGTTLDSWIVATIGFKFDLLNYALPAIAFSAIGLFLFEKHKKINLILSVIFALGILFLGLTYMKVSALELVKTFDLAAYTNHGVMIFVLIGFVLTTIIQSSSATVAITLTAIYSGIIGFESAAAIVIGSEVGTCIKILFWGLKGGADKKRVAWSNFIFNLFTALIALLILKHLLYFIDEVLQIHNHLIGLVFFQSAINLLSILLIIPFIKLFANWMEKRFREDDDKAYASDISRNLPSIPLLAADAMKNEARLFFARTLHFIHTILSEEPPIVSGFIKNLKALSEKPMTFEEQYIRLKQTEGDLLEYVSSLSKDELSPQEVTHLSDYLYTVRQCVYAAKSIKDIRHNLDDFKASANDLLHKQGEQIALKWPPFETQITRLLPTEASEQAAIESLLESTLSEEKTENLKIMNLLKNDLLNEVESSTLMNVQREIISGKKALLIGIGHLKGNDIEQK
jgi:phosphate:Na+ symporter